MSVIAVAVEGNRLVLSDGTHLLHDKDIVTTDDAAAVGILLNTASMLVSSSPGDTREYLLRCSEEGSLLHRLAGDESRWAVPHAHSTPRVSWEQLWDTETIQQRCHREAQEYVRHAAD